MANEQAAPKLSAAKHLAAALLHMRNAVDGPGLLHHEEEAVEEAIAFVKRVLRKRPAFASIIAEKEADAND